jgi:hypothetical protein
MNLESDDLTTIIEVKVWRVQDIEKSLLGLAYAQVSTFCHNNLVSKIQIDNKDQVQIGVLLAKSSYTEKNHE